MLRDILNAAPPSVELAPWHKCQELAHTLGEMPLHTQATHSSGELVPDGAAGAWVKATAGIGGGARDGATDRGTMRRGGTGSEDLGAAVEPFPAHSIWCGVGSCQTFCATLHLSNHMISIHITYQTAALCALLPVGG